jgi:serine phosphatase RsbU (regulator of sigma subunit)/anti-anti-sigma regulatory factor
LQTILVIDDVRMERVLVRHHLRELDCGEILEAEDGLAAQRLLESREVDLVITDLMMPELDGLALMRWARTARPGIVWIVLSGLETFDTAVEAIQLGAFDFLTKPCEPVRLRVSVRNALERARNERQRRTLLAELERSNGALSHKVEQLEALCGILEHQADEIQRDLRRAESIQRALLPSQMPPLGGFHVETLYRPGRHVGGDLYDVAALDDRHAALLVADACGHGVSAAMLSVLFKRRLRLCDEITGAPLSPARALADVNGALSENAMPGMFVTVAYCLLDTETGEVTVASAGHPPVLWSRQNGELEAIERTGPALGMDREAQYGETRIRLDRGDRLLLFSDGVLGAHGAGLGRLRDVVQNANSLREILGALREGVITANGEEIDDATAIALEARVGPSRLDAPTSRKIDRGSAPRARLLATTTPARAFVSVSGCCGWREAEDLQTFCERAARERLPLVLDFAGCSHLDSTFLGTVHEAVRAMRDVGGARLQRVAPALRALFEELAMDRVLERIAGESVPLPESLEPLRHVSLDTNQARERLLRAHETLASLSAHNRAEFQTVIDGLRAELAG